jgi:hypothetical protein
MWLTEQSDQDGFVVAVTRAGVIRAAPRANST